jgi:hypothetical protein
VHHIGLQYFQQSPEVGDGQHTQSPLFGSLFHPPAHSRQGIDIESGVDLVEDREPGSEHSHLQCLVPFALSTRKIDVEGAGEKPLVKANALGLGAHPLTHIAGSGIGPNFAGLDLGPGGGQRGDQRDTRYFDRMLHAEKQSSAGSLPGGQGKQVDPVEGHGSAEDLVPGSPHQHVGQGALS